MSSSRPRPAAERAARGGRRSDGPLALWLTLPTLVVLGLVVGYPVARACYRSLFDDPITVAPHFVGLANYAAALASVEFRAALVVTLFFTVVSVTLEIVLGFAMALVMHREIRGRGWIRAAILVPWAIPTAVTAVLWSWMLQPAGIVNHLLGANVLWTASAWPAKLAIVIADVWKTAPFVALLLLAGLELIPDELYEAAKLDGAGARQRFATITLPLVRRALLVAVLFRVLDVLRIYDLPALLTGGANDTTTLSLLVVRATIGNLQPGYGSALSTLTSVLILVVGIAFVRALGVDLMAAPAEEKG